MGDLQPEGSEEFAVAGEKGGSFALKLPQRHRRSTRTREEAWSAPGDLTPWEGREARDVKLRWARRLLRSGFFIKQVKFWQECWLSC